MNVMNAPLVAREALNNDRECCKYISKILPKLCIEKLKACVFDGA